MAAPAIPERPNLIGANPASDDTLPDIDGRGPDYLDVTWPTVIEATGYDTRIANPSGSRISTDVGPGFRMSGLQSNTLYMLEVRAKNSDGTSAWSPSRKAFTRPPTPARPFLDGTSPTSSDPRPQDPLTDLPLNRGTDFLQITWSPVSGVSTFEIEIDGGTPKSANQGERHTGLTANSLHKFRVRCLGVGGTSFWSDARDVFTRPPPPKPPFLAGTDPRLSDPIASVDSRGPDFLLMQWDRVGRFDRYLLQADNGTPAIRLSADVDHNFHGFAPNTSHSVRLRVADDAKGGLSFWSTAANYRTRPPAVPNFQRADFNPLPRGVVAQWSAVGAFNEDTGAVLRVHKAPVSGQQETVAEILQPEAAKSASAMDLCLPVSGTLNYFAIVGVGSNFSFNSEQFSVDVADIPSWGFELLTPRPPNRKPRFSATPWTASNSGSIFYMNDPGAGGGGFSSYVPENGGTETNDNRGGGHGFSSNDTADQTKTSSGESEDGQVSRDTIRDDGKALNNENNAHQAKPQEPGQPEKDKPNAAAARRAYDNTGSASAGSQQTSPVATPYSSARSSRSTHDPFRSELFATEPTASEASWDTSGDRQTSMAKTMGTRIGQHRLFTEAGNNETRILLELPNAKAENTKIGITVSPGENAKIEISKDGSVTIRVEKTNAGGQIDYQKWTINTRDKGNVQLDIETSEGGTRSKVSPLLDTNQGARVTNYKPFILSKSSASESPIDASASASARARQSSIQTTIVYRHDARSANPSAKQEAHKTPSPPLEKTQAASVPQKAQAIGQIVSHEDADGTYSISVTKTAKYDPQTRSPATAPEKGLGDKQDRLRELDRSAKGAKSYRENAGVPQDYGFDSGNINKYFFFDMAATRTERAPGIDSSIEVLNLAEPAKSAAYQIKAKHPWAVFTSGRRDIPGQARAMAGNVATKERNWIKKTYKVSPVSIAAQKWVDSHPEAKTQKAITDGLLSVFQSLPASEVGGISLHLVGLAFDIQPITSKLSEIKPTINSLIGKDRFLEEEGGLIRWHVQFKSDPQK